MKQDKSKYINNIATIFVFTGVIFVFISVWSSGWNILRMFITGLILIIWGKGLWNKYEEELDLEDCYND